MSKRALTLEDPIRRIRRLLGRSARIPPSLPSGDVLPRVEAARVFWSERAWSELAAIPALARTSLALIRERGTLDTLDAVALIQSDEVRHAELSIALADGFGGFVAEVPADSGFDPSAAASGPDDELVFWVLAIGCLSETISLELMRTRLLFTTHPVVKAVLGRIAKDEAIHARLGWSLAERLFPRAESGTREALGDYAEDMLGILGRTFVTHGMAPSLRRATRRRRTQVTDLGLGAAPPSLEDEVFWKIRDEVIRPRLARLGVPI
ncbi:MAG: ferritin-like domain-containing protein [Deltaproteobacteria bacterium]|nr:ferritin-like domain-containing protein [Deltaproteobacteria bacterium]